MTEAAACRRRSAPSSPACCSARASIRHQIEVEIEPFKGLLLGLFFMTVGMSFDLAALSADLPHAACRGGRPDRLQGHRHATPPTRLFGVEPAVAVEAAFVLAGAGEFAFVVFTLARRAGVLAPDFYQFLLSVAALSMLATPLLAAVGRRIGSGLRRARTAPAMAPVPASAVLADHVVIGGFGRVGRDGGAPARR